jgi:hypothetical protein
LSRVARREADNLAESARAQAGTDPALELHVGLTRPATERVRKTGQMRLLHHFTVLAMATMTLIATAGGCTHIAEAIDCDEMCREVQDCVDSDLDVHRCAERCEDKVDDSPLARQLDACTDCLDRDLSCTEADERCAVCDEVRVALMP